MVLELVSTVRSRFFTGIQVFNLLAVLIAVSVAFTNPVYAESQTEETEIEENTEENEEKNDYTWNTFYVPKSQFMTESDYEAYCESMYNLGYMDEHYEWTSAAKKFIENPENQEIADELEADRQKRLQERESVEISDNNNDLEDEEQYTDNNDDKEYDSQTKPGTMDEVKDEEKNEESSSFNISDIIVKFFAAIFVVGVIVFTYKCYKKSQE